MGGPEIKTRFGRKDAKDSSESVESQVGRYGGWTQAGRAQRAETQWRPVEETAKPQKDGGLRWFEWSLT